MLGWVTSEEVDMVQVSCTELSAIARLQILLYTHTLRLSR
jgi:hypothetical protein